MNLLSIVSKFAESPATGDLVHRPELVNVLRQTIAHVLQMGGKNEVTRFHRLRRESDAMLELRGTIETVAFDVAEGETRLDGHFLFGQHRFEEWCSAVRWSMQKSAVFAAEDESTTSEQTAILEGMRRRLDTHLTREEMESAG